MYKYTDLRDFFIKDQIVKYNGLRLLVSCVEGHEIWLTNHKQNISIRCDSDDINKIENLEPLLQRDIDLSSLKNITKSRNQKHPVLTEKHIKSIINKLEPTKEIRKKWRSQYPQVEEAWLDFKKKFTNKVEFHKIEGYVKNRLYKEFSVDELAKIIYSSSFTNSDRGMVLEENNPTLFVISKITSSYWKNVFVSDNWNQVVDSYNKIKSFSLNKEGFSIRLDTTTGSNEKGYSRFNRTYIDGVFSYVLYYKDKPVANIGFSVTANKKGDNIAQLLQIQCINKKGNRWIYKFGQDYVEQITKSFLTHFKGTHTVQLMKAESMVASIQTTYTDMLKKYKYYYDECDNNTYINKNDKNKELNRWQEKMDSVETLLESFKLKGVQSINKVLGYKFDSIKRVKCNEKFNNLVLK